MSDRMNRIVRMWRQNGEEGGVGDRQKWEMEICT